MPLSNLVQLPVLTEHGTIIEAVKETFVFYTAGTRPLKHC